MLLSLRSRTLRGAGCAGTLALATQLLAGCYTYTPVDTSLRVPTDTEVAVEINDRGRYELNGSIGQSPKRVEGRLLAASDSTLTVAVRNVIALTGERAEWAGESVAIRRTGVTGVEERKFSKSRSFLGAALAIAAVVVVFVTTGLIGGGSGSPGDGTEPPPGNES